MIPLLMIDDDEKLVALTREYLEPQGFRLESAHDGPSGLVAARTGQAALVILDLMLPGLDGLALCRKLRRSSQVPILMLTARGDETDRIVGLETGADDYLPKPFNPRELLARVRAILRRGDATRSERADGLIDLGWLVVDPAARTVVAHGAPVPLTTAEFDVLWILARNAGRVLTREALLRHAHGPGWAAYDRSIDVHISRIRQKIEPHPRRPTGLKTVRGVGYLVVRAGVESS